MQVTSQKIGADCDLEFKGTLFFLYLFVPKMCYLVIYFGYMAPQKLKPKSSESGDFFYFGRDSTKILANNGEEVVFQNTRICLIMQICEIYHTCKESEIEHKHSQS